MARNPPTSERLSLIEETMAPMLVELLMFRILLDRLLDFDLARADALDVDPYRFLIEEELNDEFIATAGTPTNPVDRVRLEAVIRALDFLDRVDPDETEDDIPSGPGAANDD